MSEDDWKGWARAAGKEAKGIIKPRRANEKGRGHYRWEGRARNPWQGVNQLLAQVYYYTAVTSSPTLIAFSHLLKHSKPIKFIKPNQVMPTYFLLDFHTNRDYKHVNEPTQTTHNYSLYLGLPGQRG